MTTRTPHRPAPNRLPPLRPRPVSDPFWRLLAHATAATWTIAAVAVAAAMAWSG